MHLLSKLMVFFFLTLSFHAPTAWGECVKTNWTSLKTGPGPQYPVKWTVPKNTPLKIIERQNAWALVEEVDRVRSWASLSDLTKDYFCGIVIKEKTLLRKRGKAKKRKKREYAYYDEAYKILKFKKRKSVLVKNEIGRQGWIKRKYLWVH